MAWTISPNVKILLIHNYYGTEAPSGENAVFDAEIQLLQLKGHRVSQWIRHSDDIRQNGLVGATRGGISVPWNFFSHRNVKKLICEEQPDIMHVHNTFPLVSPSIFHAAKGTDTATVLTLHNYRLFCAAAIPMRDDNPCTLCLDQKSVFPALRFGCYRQSRLATLPLAASIALHRRLKTWERHVDAFIALTEFQRDLMVKAGLPSEKVHIKAHFYESPPKPRAWPEREDKCVFIGRLSSEKGVHVLIEAWRHWGNQSPRLEIIGDGPDKKKLEAQSRKYGLEDKIFFHGQLPFNQAQKMLGRSKLLLLPSLCFEGFPMVIREAFALGVPVAASNLGSMPCLINEETGWLFEPGNAGTLVTLLHAVWKDQSTLKTKGMAARVMFEAKYTSESSYQALLNIYQQAIQRRNSLRGK